MFKPGDRVRAVTDEGGVYLFEHGTVNGYSDSTLYVEVVMDEGEELCFWRPDELELISEVKPNVE